MAHADRVVAALVANGFDAAAANARAASFIQCAAGVDAIGGDAHGRVHVWAPGRIEVFGKHTDYAGGRSLLTAVERGFSVVAAPRTDARIRVIDASGDNACETALDVAASAPDGQWSNYVATVARRVARNFPDAHAGLDLAFVSDLPSAAGVSSSSALMIGVFSALAAVNRLPDTATWRQSLATLPELGGYMGAMENGLTFGALGGDSGVGTLGGSQDQTAILCAEPGQVVDFAWMPVRKVGAHALSQSKRFVVASSGVVAEKSAGARELYNRASLLVRHLVAIWNKNTGRSDHSLAAVVQSQPDAADRLREMLVSDATDRFPAAALRDRFEQFLLETYTLIPAASAAFELSDWAALGEVAARSQRAAEELLGNQVPETMALVAEAKSRGAVAASAFGAGFGGSVWALVDSSDADRFQRDWSESYRQRFPDAAARAMFFTTAAGPAAVTWSDEASDR